VFIVFICGTKFDMSISIFLHTLCLFSNFIAGLFIFLCTLLTDPLPGAVTHFNINPLTPLAAEGLSGALPFSRQTGAKYTSGLFCL